MGKKPRVKPRHLGKKLRQIRRALGLSQNEMLKRMGLDGDYGRNNLSNFERDRREPPSPILLGYARLARIRVDLILDDKLELPDRLLKIPANSRVTY
jgi:transcriptional regulator with XRE-family HTH domain